MKKNKLLILTLILIILIALIIVSLLEKEVKPDERKFKVVEVSRLCEVENPKFNYNEECKKIIDEKYADLECTFEFTNLEYFSMGSCSNCTIICK